MKNMSPEAIEQRYPNIWKDMDPKLIVEIFAEELGKIDHRFKALEERLGDSAQDRRSVVLSSRELRTDVERMLGEQGAEIRGLRNELNAMRAEFDILRQCLSPKDKISAKAAVSMLRSVR